MSKIKERRDKDIFNIVIESRNFLFETQLGLRILEVISNSVGKISSAFVVYDVAQQGQNVMDVLVNGDIVVSVVIFSEDNRPNENSKIEIYGIDDVDTCRKFGFYDRNLQLDAALKAAGPCSPANTGCAHG